jgi:hypothetical protein
VKREMRGFDGLPRQLRTRQILRVCRTAHRGESRQDGQRMSARGPAARRTRSALVVRRGRQGSGHATRSLVRTAFPYSVLRDDDLPGRMKTHHARVPRRSQRYRDMKPGTRSPGTERGTKATGPRPTPQPRAPLAVSSCPLRLSRLEGVLYPSEGEKEQRREHVPKKQVHPDQGGVEGAEPESRPQRA